MSAPDAEQIAAYAEQAAALLPEGPAWQGFRDADGRGHALLLARSATWWAVHKRMIALMAEALPWLAATTLATRETEAGLPDQCTAGRATTIAERRAAVGAKWLGAGFGHRIEDFEALAASLGYSVTVTAGKPFRCGISRCGVDDLNPWAAGITLKIVVHGKRKTRFRCGISQIGVDPLCKVQVAKDLECMVRRRAHSHVNLIFLYLE